MMQPTHQAHVHSDGVGAKILASLQIVLDNLEDASLADNDPGAGMTPMFDLGGWAS